MEHLHDFHSWTFSDSVTKGVFTTRQVLEGLHPVLDVYHSPDGDWQFLCGTTLAEEDLKLVCFGCMIERDSSLLELADLPISWCASRTSQGGPWTRERHDERKDEA
jgi:hypothetical protein